MSYPEETHTTYPSPAAAPGSGPVGVELKELAVILDEVDGAFGDLRGRLATVLDQRETDEAIPGPGPSEVRRSPSCEVGCAVEEAVRRLRSLRRAMIETTRRVEL
jgi:hypothetical protein